jgi:deoxyribose-phosphate aldolase
LSDVIARGAHSQLELNTAVTLEAHSQNTSAIASLIDHTLLKPEATEAEIVRLCREADKFRFASVCVNPCWVAHARHVLEGAGVAICTVIGFPLGANEPTTKLKEAELAIEHGATELDMVQNIGALRSGNFEFVRNEFAQLAELAHSNRTLLKIIIETSLLSREQKLEACALAKAAGADFVKTSTGFSGSGATVEDVSLMREAVGDALGVKASGGVRSLAALREMVRAGANRIGTSSGVSILEELRAGEQAGGLAQSAEASAAATQEPY